MQPSSYRFEIDASVDLVEVEMSLHLAMITLEGLFGTAAVRLDARYHLDEPGRAFTIEASTTVGAALVRVFTTLLSREFGDDSFVVRPLLGAGVDQPAVGDAFPAAGLAGGRVA